MTSPTARNIFLNNEKILINSICYVIDEYLAPVNVLICSKCCVIGHFHRQCPEADETIVVTGTGTGRSKQIFFLPDRYKFLVGFILILLIKIVKKLIFFKFSLFSH